MIARRPRAVPVHCERALGSPDEAADPCGWARVEDGPPRPCLPQGGRLRWRMPFRAPRVASGRLSSDLEDSKPAPKKHTSIHSLVQGMSTAGPMPSDSFGSGIGRGSSMCRDHHHHRKERENESPEVKLGLKIACADALWMLSRGSISNSRKITETKGLLCLSKIVEKEKGNYRVWRSVVAAEVDSIRREDAAACSGSALFASFARA
ncbi:uncharacterized protein A4U43_C09F16900 [Asparagus officinalis]|uniref:Uncharacterized protein n=1 Tax=Asparagus officinalis TaxID=4686 RepID=A0A5P1E847_ASPOF|nr:uncharacterized protein A4U43_C09F16900 [Asparagus officinalis]